MANVAAGIQCPHDGTLVTCVGDSSSYVLKGACPVCGHECRIRNLQYSGALAGGHGSVDPVHDAAPSEPLVVTVDPDGMLISISPGITLATSSSFAAADLSATFTSVSTAPTFVNVDPSLSAATVAVTS